MTRDGILCFLGFQNFPGEDPQNPLVQSNTTQHKNVINEVYNSKEWTCTQVGSTSLICDMLAKDLLYPLSVNIGLEKTRIG